MNAKSCFVIAPIGKPDTPTRARSDKVLKEIIQPAVAECGYTAIRADGIDSPGMVTSHMIQRIFDDSLVIADLTEHNPNVFYEIAVRHAVHKPIVQLIEESEQIPFDVAGMRAIRINHKDDASFATVRQQIVTHIRALERDPRLLQTPLSIALNQRSIENSFPHIVSSLAERFDKDPWLGETIKKLFFIRDLDQNKFSRAHNEREIRKRLEARIAYLLSASIPYPMGEELQRMDRLLETLRQAEEYYFAVTLVAGTYLESFFLGEYFKEYVEAHIDALNRTPPVTIKRVFVIDNDLAACNGDPTLQEDKKIMCKLMQEHDQMQVGVRVVKIPPTWSQWQTSFIVCDNQVASESYSLRDGGLSDGYWGFDPQKIDRLKAKFNELKFFPDLSAQFRE